MKNLITLVIFLFFCNISFAQRKAVSDTTQKKNQNSSVNTQNTNKKNQDSTEVHITPGASGVKRSIGYKFSASPEVGDPGNGVFRYDKENASEARYIIVDDIDISGEDQTKWYSTWDDTTGATGRGGLTVADSKGKILAVFNFTGVFTDSNGFWKLPVEYISGTLPLDGSVCYYVFDRIVHRKVPEGANQGNQAVAAAVVTTEAVVAAQANNHVQVVQTEQVTPVTDTTRVIQVTDTAKVIHVTDSVKVIQVTDTAKAVQSNQGNQAIAATVVTAGAVVTAQANNRTPVVQGNQGNRRAETTQTTQPTQTKPVTQTTQPTQTKPVTQTTRQTQQTQPAPAKQYNQFPVVQNIFESPGTVRRRWYRGIIEVGYALGPGDYGINNFKFNFINAIRIGQYSSIGLGIGYRHLFTENNTAPYLVSSENQIPVFLDLRTSFSTKKLTPYLAMGIGGSSGYSSSETKQEGLLLNASGGIWYNVSDRFAVFGGIVWEMQKLEFSDTDPISNNYKKNANSLGINIGISF